MRTLLLIGAAILTVGCNQRQVVSQPDPIPDGTTYIPAFEQRTGGNPDSGYHYLVYGDYVCAGIPYAFMQFSLPQEGENELNRTGESARLPRNLNLFETDNGVQVAGGITCFGCHSSELNGELVLGLGNAASDFTNDLAPRIEMITELLEQTYGKDSREYQAYLPLYRGGMAAAAYTIAPFKGVNPAFMIEKSVLAHRDPQSLEWTDAAQYEIDHEIVCTDVPPLWNVKKKHALYYTALGRGDFTKGLMQVMVVGMSDTTQARRIHREFEDVLAWIYQLEPPKYPETIDNELAMQGEVIFNDRCSKCHGTYGEKETYPNLVVDLDKVKTDPMYARAFTGTNNELEEWFNESWFAQSQGAAYSAAVEGYIAPPLDGIWATAPYLHNGSVPNLEQVLNSDARPTFWKRSFESDDFDYDRVGWRYQEMESADDVDTYNTTLPGYSNQGHYFGNRLTDIERSAVVEYLKTL